MCRLAILTARAFRAGFRLVLSYWGPCGGGPEPDDLEDVVDCMGLDWPDDWVNFEDAPENGSSATQENEICWMEHYFEVDCDGACFCTPDCPSSDPWGGH